MATTAQKTAQSTLQGFLDQYGLGSLSGWLWQQFIASGTNDPASFLQMIGPELRQRPEYVARFPAMKTLADRGQAITESQYISYEQQVSQVMHSAGLPAWFYDKPADFAKLLESNLSPSEVQDRVIKGYAQIENAPPEVRQTFQEFFGPSGDNALAAFFLDPDHAEPKLEQQVQAATVGGIGARYGVGATLGVDTQLAQNGVTAAAAEQGFATLQKSAGLFDANVGESPDLRLQQEGVAATFGLDPAARLAVERRAQARQAAFTGSGEAQQTKAGAIGLGEAGQP